MRSPCSIPDIERRRVALTLVETLRQALACHGYRLGSLTMKRALLLLSLLGMLLSLSSCFEHRYRQGHFRGDTKAAPLPATESRYYPLR